MIITTLREQEYLPVKKANEILENLIKMFLQLRKIKHFLRPSLYIPYFLNLGIAFLFFVY